MQLGLKAIEADKTLLEPSAVVPTLVRATPTAKKLKK